MTLAEFLLLVNDTIDSAKGLPSGKLTNRQFDELREWMESEEFNK